MEVLAVETTHRSKHCGLGVVDIEANGLYYTVTKFHCGVVIDPVTNECYSYRPDELDEFIDHLLRLKGVIGHNIIDYDLPALEKLSGRSLRGVKILDTLVVARAYNPDILGGHSLKAWGKRLGEYKGDYGEQENAWDEFSEAMLEYCIQDVRVNVKLHLYLINLIGGEFYGKYV